MVLVLPDNGRDPELTQVLQSAQEEYYTSRLRKNSVIVEQNVEPS